MNNLQSLPAELQANTDVIRELSAPLSEDLLNWRPNPSEWSVMQCISHLDKTTRAYVPAIDEALRRAPTLSQPIDEVKVGFLSRFFLSKMAEPQSMKGKAPKIIQPEFSAPKASTWQSFEDSQSSMAGLMRTALDVDVNSVRIHNPFIPVARFTAGVAFIVVIVHQRRHIAQMRRILEARR